MEEPEKEETGEQESREKVIDNQDRPDKEESSPTYMTEGLCIGLCLGLAIGQLLFKNAGIGLCIGMSIGLAVGTGIKKKR